MGDTLNTASDWSERAERLRQEGHEREALAAASQALKLDANQPKIWGLIGLLLLKRGKWRDAESYLRQGVTLDPENAVMRSHLAMALMEQDRLGDAQAETDIALQKNPHCADALMMQAEILCRTGRYADAIPYYKKAHAAGGIGNAALFGQATATFLTGGYDEGLRLLCEAAPAKDKMNLPDWKGEANPGLHVVLCGEYGFGDILHFVRYIPELKKRVGKVTMNLPEELIGILQNSFPGIGIMKRGEALPEGANSRCFYMDLPHFLGKFDAKADMVPYLAADKEQTREWEKRFTHIPHPRIGLVWAGNPLHQNDHNRSVPFADLAPLIERARPHLISFQRDGREQAAGAGIFDATGFIKNFADSAAAFSKLDLLITTDSAPCHLAGALGIPVWTLVPFNPDWRWLLGREDCIWYPTMKLYRQEKPKDWASVIEKACADLRKTILKQ